MDETPRTPEDRARLAREVKKRRLQLEMAQTQLEAAGGPSVSFVSKVESRKPVPYDGISIVRLERALQWEEGSVAAILDGGRPTPINVSAITPEMVTAKAVIPQPAKTPLESLNESAMVEAILAMAREQAKLADEIKKLQQQVDDLHRSRDQQDHGDPDNRASA
ncbi:MULTISPECIES: hypothetical protein [Streptosporangiaceae]|jgi:hypothetical protein|uniref:hypothetical protein n=1 Tax=Streptosporangiaceae TaxID=2004 RepID=UPI0033CF50F8